MAGLIADLRPDVHITIEFHVHAGNPVLTEPEKPLTVAQAAEALNISPVTVRRLAIGRQRTGTPRIWNKRPDKECEEAPINAHFLRRT